MTNIKKGKLPLTQIIKLESNKDQWGLFAKKLITSFSTFGIVAISDEKKVRIEIEVETIIPPESFHSVHDLKLHVSHLSQGQAEGMLRAQNFFNDFSEKTLWFMIGCIKGENKAPIIIMHYEVFDLSIYSQKLENEEMKRFVQINPRDN